MHNFITKKEKQRASWAREAQSIACGTPYDDEVFPEHEFLRLASMGEEVKMVDLNVGTAIVRQFSSDAVTDYEVTVENESGIDEEETEEMRKLLKQSDFMATLREAAEQLVGTGYNAFQPIRIDGGNEQEYAIVTIDSSKYFPTLPAYTYQEYEEVRVIYDVRIKTKEATQKDAAEYTNYKIIEVHTIGQIEYKAYEVGDCEDMAGNEISIQSIKGFEGYDDVVKTDLDHIPIIQVDLEKGASKFFGTSIFTGIYEQLKKISEIDTIMRNEIYKHGSSKMAADTSEMPRVAANLCGCGSVGCLECASCMNNAQFDMSSEILPVNAGGIVPQYITKDLKILEIGPDLIDRTLEKIAGIIGAPSSIFNVQDRSGSTRVETDRRKEKRYTRQIYRIQDILEYGVEQSLQTILQWKGKDATVRFKLEDPFEQTLNEKCELVRKLNPSDKLLSREKALKMLFNEMSQDEIDLLISDISGEENAEFSSLTSLTPRL